MDKMHFTYREDVIDGRTSPRKSPLLWLPKKCDQNPSYFTPVLIFWCNSFMILKGLNNNFWTQNSFHFQCSKLIMYPILNWKAKFEHFDDKDKKDIQPPNLCYVNKDWGMLLFTKYQKMLELHDIAFMR